MKLSTLKRKDRDSTSEPGFAARKKHAGGRAPATRAQTSIRQPAVTDHDWEPNKRVWVRVRGRGILMGKVDRIIEPAINVEGWDYDYALRVLVE